MQYCVEMGHDMCSQLIFEIQKEPRTYILVGFKQIQPWCWGWEKNIVEIIVVSLQVHPNKYNSLFCTYKEDGYSQSGLG